MAMVAASAPARTVDEIRGDYAVTWARLVARDVDVVDDLDAIEASDEVGRAWTLMGEMLVATLRAQPGAGADDMRRAVPSLDVEDCTAVCHAKYVAYEQEHEYVEEY